MAEKLRDLSQPIDVPLLDAMVATFYGMGSKEERAAADQILQELQSNPDTWLQAVHILQNAQNLNTKFLTLQLLEGVIKYRWNTLPVEQRDGMKNYISEVIVQLSSDEASFCRERLYANKLNIILVQILKHEWPARWKSFIPDLVSAAKTSETICENYMTILKLTSKEVLDFSRGVMSQQKIKELKESLNSEFQLIQELCLFVLLASQRTELIRATLETLHAFLSWIPLVYIFEMPLLETLVKFFPVASYRNLTLQCLTKVAARQIGDFYDMQYVKMYTIFMVQLQTILPPGTNIPKAYANGSSEEQAFIQNLAPFFTSFYKSHIRILEATPENRAALLLGLEYLIGISDVDNTEVFKVCLDYWNFLVLELFEAHHNLDTPAATPLMDFQTPMIPGMVDGIGSPLFQRRQLYSGPMSKLRILMICQMAKFEEVLIVEDENGNIVRETMKDNAVFVQYQIMKETLIYLSHLDHEDTEQQVDARVTTEASDMNNGNCNVQDLASLPQRILSRRNRTVVSSARRGHGRGNTAAEIWRMNELFMLYASLIQAIPGRGDIEEVFSQNTDQLLSRNALLGRGIACIALSAVVMRAIAAINFQNRSSAFRALGKWLCVLSVVLAVLGVNIMALSFRGGRGGRCLTLAKATFYVSLLLAIGLVIGFSTLGVLSILSL